MDLGYFLTQRRAKKLIVLFIGVFAFSLLLIWLFSPDIPDNRIMLKASQLESHSLFIAPSGLLEFHLSNDIGAQCFFLGFPYANAGNFHTLFIAPVEAREEFLFEQELSYGDALGLMCTAEGFGFEWKNLPVLIAAEQEDTVLHLEIKDNRFLEKTSGSELKSLSISSDERVWFVVQNSDSEHFSFDFLSVQGVDARDRIDFVSERYWPGLDEGRVIVLGPMEIAQGSYLLELNEFHCLEDCEPIAFFELLVD